MSFLIANRLEGIVSDRANAHLRRFRRDAEALFPGRITDVILFGSRARHNAKRGSDYDVAVFFRDLIDRRSIDDMLTDAAMPYLLGGTHIRPISVPSNFLAKPYGTLLASEIARDGISIQE